MAEDRVAPAASPVSVLVAEAMDHSSARPSFMASLIRFCITGVASVGADVVVLAALYKGAGLSLGAATLAGSGVALIVNYTVNRSWTFQARASHGYTLTRYALLAALNVVTTYLIVRGLSGLGLYWLLSKLVAVAFNAGINFLSARYWVFKH